MGKVLALADFRRGKNGELEKASEFSKVVNCLVRKMIDCDLIQSVEAAGWQTPEVREFLDQTQDDHLLEQVTKKLSAVEDSEEGARALFERITKNSSPKTIQAQITGALRKVQNQNSPIDGAWSDFLLWSKTYNILSQEEHDTLKNLDLGGIADQDDQVNEIKECTNTLKRVTEEALSVLNTINRRFENSTTQKSGNSSKPASQLSIDITILVQNALSRAGIEEERSTINDCNEIFKTLLETNRFDDEEFSLFHETLQLIEPTQKGQTKSWVGGIDTKKDALDFLPESLIETFIWNVFGEIDVNTQRSRYALVGKLTLFLQENFGKVGFQKKELMELISQWTYDRFDIQKFILDLNSTFLAQNVGQDLENKFKTIFPKLFQEFLASANQERTKLNSFQSSVVQLSFRIRQKTDIKGASQGLVELGQNELSLTSTEKTWISILIARVNSELDSEQPLASLSALTEITPQRRHLEYTCQECFEVFNKLHSRPASDPKNKVKLEGFRAVWINFLRDFEDDPEILKDCAVSLKCLETAFENPVEESEGRQLIDIAMAESIAVPVYQVIKDITVNNENLDKRIVINQFLNIIQKFLTWGFCTAKDLESALKCYKENNNNPLFFLYSLTTTWHTRINDVKNPSGIDSEAFGRITNMSKEFSTLYSSVQQK